MSKSKDVYNKIPYGCGLLVHCPKCGFEGEPDYKISLNKYVLIALVLLGIFPGIFYYFLKNLNNYCVCPKCRSCELGEINGDNDLIMKLKKYQFFQNLITIGLFSFFVLFVLNEIMRFVQ